jgi:hypothetical protein
VRAAWNSIIVDDFRVARVPQWSPTGAAPPAVQRRQGGDFVVGNLIVLLVSHTLPSVAGRRGRRRDRGLCRRAQRRSPSGGRKGPEACQDEGHARPPSAVPSLPNPADCRFGMPLVQGACRFCKIPGAAKHSTKQGECKGRAGQLKGRSREGHRGLLAFPAQQDGG